MLSRFINWITRDDSNKTRVVEPITLNDIEKALLLNNYAVVVFKWSDPGKEYTIHTHRGFKHVHLYSKPKGYVNRELIMSYVDVESFFSAWEDQIKTINVNTVPKPRWG